MRDDDVPPRVRFTRALGAVPDRDAPGKPTVVGQDGGQSIALGPDAHLFVFSDTLVRPTADAADRPGAAYFLPNCAALARGADHEAALRSLAYFGEDDGLPAPILRATAAERRRRIRFWPEHGVVIGDRVFLYYLGIRHLDVRRPWSFELAGCGLAELDPASGRCVRLARDGDWILWPGEGVRGHFGAQALRYGEHVLIYATVETALGRRAQLHRVAPADIADPRAYEVLRSSRPEWRARASGAAFTDACDLGPCGTDVSVAFNPWLDAWLMVYASTPDGHLTLRRARHPWGPFSAPLDLGALPREPASELAYLAFAHPQLASGDGQEIVVTYCQPHFVRNRLLKITFERP